MRVEYDPASDTLYIELSDSLVEYTEDVSPGRQYDRGIDYAADGTPVGVEFLNASRGVDLTGIPRSDEIAGALERVRGIRVLV